MPWNVLIDGYNVLRNWPQFEREWEENWEHARKHLIRMVGNYAAHEGHRVILVFDGQFTKQKRAKRSRQHGIEIVYTAQGQTADEYITQWVQRRSDDRHVEVITSDRGLARDVMQHGAEVLSTLEFQDTYTRTGGKSWESGLQDADPRLADRLDPSVRSKLEQLKRKK